jgi:hypothetical protein
MCNVCLVLYKVSTAEAEFLDVIGKKVLRVFLLAIHSHLNLKHLCDFILCKRRHTWTAAFLLYAYILGVNVIIKKGNKNVENMQVLGLLCMMCAAPAFEDTQHWFLLVVTGNLESYS